MGAVKVPGDLQVRWVQHREGRTPACGHTARSEARHLHSRIRVPNHCILLLLEMQPPRWCHSSITKMEGVTRTRSQPEEAGKVRSSLSQEASRGFQMGTRLQAEDTQLAF
jgi:hypothetical protein